MTRPGPPGSGESQEHYDGRDGSEDTWTFLARSLDASYRASRDDALKVGSELAGPKHPILPWLVHLMRCGATDTLRRIYEEDTPLHQILGDVPGFAWDPEQADRLTRTSGVLGVFRDDDAETTAVHALRALAGLGFAAEREQRRDECLCAALAWFREAHSSLSAKPVTWTPAEISGDDQKLRTLLERLAVLAGEECLTGAVLTTAVTLERLCAERPASTQASWSIRVLFDAGTAGLRGELKLAFVPGLPPGLLPDPAGMTLFSADRRFQESLDVAWSLAGAGRIHGAVLWSIHGNGNDNGDTGPFRYITDGSLGAAFAVGLDEVARLHRPAPSRGRLRWALGWIPRLGHVRRLVGGNSLVGMVDLLGNLQSVDGYERKLQAAGPGARLIIPLPDEERAERFNSAAKPDDRAEIVAVPDWKHAARKARGRSNRALAKLGVYLMTPLLVIAGVWVWLANTQAADERRQKQIEQLISDSKRLRDRDPVTSLKVAIAAQRLANGEASRTNLIETVLKTRYTGALTGPVAYPSFLGYSGGGRTLVTADAAEILIWDPGAGKVEGRIPITGDGRGVEVAVNPVTSLIAVRLGDTRIEIWDVENRATPDRVGEIALSRQVSELEFSRDGALLAAGGSAMSDPDSVGIALWDLKNPSSPRKLAELDTDRPHTFALSADGRKIAVAGGGTVDLFDITHPDRPAPSGVIHHDEINPITDLAFDPTGNIVYTTTSKPLSAGAGAGNEFVSRWFTYGSDDPVLLGKTRGQGEIEVSPNGLLATTDENDTILVGDSQIHPDGVSATATPAVPPSQSTGTIMAFSPDGRTLATRSRGNEIRFWDVSDLTPAEDVEAILGSDGLAVSPRGTILAVAGSHALNSTLHDVMLYDIATPGRYRRIAILSLSAREITALAFGTDGRTLLIGASNEHDVAVIERWDVAVPGVPQRKTAIETHTGPARSLALSADGRVLTVAEPGDQVSVRDVSDPDRPGAAVPLQFDNIRADSEVQEDDLPSVSFSPRGRTVAVNSGSGISLWNTDDPARPKRLSTLAGEVHRGRAQEVLFDPAGTQLAAGRQRWTITDPARPMPIAPLPTPVGLDSVSLLAADLDGTIAVTGDGGRDVAFWYLRGDMDPIKIGGALHNAPSHSVYVPGGYVLSASFEDVKVLDITRVLAAAADPVAVACRAVRHGLSEEEWKVRVRDIPYLDTCG